MGERIASREGFGCLVYCAGSMYVLNTVRPRMFARMVATFLQARLTGG